jgi:hypothetical protein
MSFHRKLFDEVILPVALKVILSSKLMFVVKLPVWLNVILAGIDTLAVAVAPTVVPKVVDTNLIASSSFNSVRFN